MSWTAFVVLSASLIWAGALHDAVMAYHVHLGDLGASSLQKLPIVVAAPFAVVGSVIAAYLVTSAIAKVTGQNLTRRQLLRRTAAVSVLVAVAAVTALFIPVAHPSGKIAPTIFTFAVPPTVILAAFFTATRTRGKAIGIAVGATVGVAIALAYAVNPPLDTYEQPLRAPLPGFIAVILTALAPIAVILWPRRRPVTRSSDGTAPAPSQ